MGFPKGAMGLAILRKKDLVSPKKAPLSPCSWLSNLTFSSLPNHVDRNREQNHRFPGLNRH